MTSSPESQDLGYFSFRGHILTDFYAMATKVPSCITVASDNKGNPKRTRTCTLPLTTSDNEYDHTSTITITCGTSKVKVKFKPNGTDKLILGMKEEKLLAMAICKFTETIDPVADIKEGGVPSEKLKVRIPLDDYIEALGFPVLPKQSQKVIQARKNARIAIKQALMTLESIQIIWMKNPKIPTSDYMSTRLISKHGISKGNIEMNLDTDLGNWLARRGAKMYVPRSLWLLDERNKSSFFLGWTMCEHYCQNKNAHPKSANRLKVETLLQKTALPTIDNSSVKRASWKERIKRRLENAIDCLVEHKVIKKWEYSQGGQAIKKEEADTMDFKEWASLIVVYEPVPEPVTQPPFAIAI